MTYNCEKFIDSYIEAFNRTSKKDEEKRGLALPKMEDISTLEDELMALFFPGLSGSESKSKLISVVTYHMESVTRLLYDSVLLALSYEDKGNTPIRSLEDKAEAIIDSIKLRTTNLHKIAIYLVNKQREFFDKGISHLLPDSQQNMASYLDLSASTVSRLCAKKYIETDWGTFPISFFFSSTRGFLKDDKEEASKNAIKARIKELLENWEGAKAPSDQKISDALAKEGIKVARRTVAKYRAELAIESSYNRN